MIYLDSCALVKIVLDEPESQALEEHLFNHASTMQISSELAALEVIRALVRLEVDGEVRSNAKVFLKDFARLPVKSALPHAMDQPDRYLRSLDALHLATAEMFGSTLTQFITYDKRLAQAAEDAGLPVVAPA
ncbi:type II toxin-antitoxin system VapC family toxin [Umezawaea sp. Da 62-37]|uniref:type II toxin-antitoxin system VapC family toxin n=1 Tax=Umezawaea sp. Da 62-37 TaxID=3075927 RepID=UPI0028F7348C|nr:type II toxin-antitoxin system VapC family toxin [Umezawaea sp. Da 62-37]WNV83566.1 type II toxin-antitoxin system VapC family toxin [Umezawaea sp. Da 62-37]